MAPPPPMHCSAPECHFQTPDTIPTYELVIQSLSIHTQAAHPTPAAVQAAAAPKSRLEKLPRPTFTLNMSESKWNFTVIQWNNYIGQSAATTEEIKLMQLQAACDDDLRQRVFDTGNYQGLNTTKLFLDKMKDLAVITVHKSVHLRNLWTLSQESDKQICAFAAKVTSTADMCGITIHCDMCNTDISYWNNVVQQIIIHGMWDTDIKVWVLSRNTSGELINLDKLIDYIAVEEAGMQESLNLSSHNTVSSILQQSNYKKSQCQPQAQSGSCKYCGCQKHSQSNNEADQ